MGIVTTGKGITVHTIDCEMLEDFADAAEKRGSTASLHDELVLINKQRAL